MNKINQETIFELLESARPFLTSNLTNVGFKEFNHPLNSKASRAFLFTSTSGQTRWGEVSVQSNPDNKSCNDDELILEISLNSPNNDDSTKPERSIKRVVKAGKSHKFDQKDVAQLSKVISRVEEMFEEAVCSHKNQQTEKHENVKKELNSIGISDNYHHESVNNKETQMSVAVNSRANTELKFITQDADFAKALIEFARNYQANK